jgi:hypothetical protein
VSTSFGELPDFFLAALTRSVETARPLSVLPDPKYSTGLLVSCPVERVRATELHSQFTQDIMPMNQFSLPKLTLEKKIARK